MKSRQVPYKACAGGESTKDPCLRKGIKKTYIDFLGEGEENARKVSLWSRYRKKWGV